MNVLALGHGKGSWEIRGHQLAAAIGARVTSKPTPADWQWADLAYIVKRCEPLFGPGARAAGVPIVWDALDCWKQPDQNTLDEANAIRDLQARIATIKPVLTLGATRRQADDAGGVYLPHHSRPGLEPSPARPEVRLVAYEGSERYLGAWRGRLEASCRRRGWRFVLNPPDLREADLVVAFRDGPWDGWACRHWKSGVKIVNAIAAGRPILTQDSAAFSEIGPHGTVVETAGDLDAAFASWEDHGRRAAVVDECRALARAYTLGVVAGHVRQILATLAEGGQCAS